MLPTPLNMHVILIIGIVGLLKTSVAEEPWPPADFVDFVASVRGKCLEKVGVDNNIVADARKGTFPDDDKLKQYLLCVFQSFDWINTEHHDFEYWKILRAFPQSMRKTVFNMGRGCLHIKDEDYPAASLEFVRCLHKHDPDHFSFLF